MEQMNHQPDIISNTPRKQTMHCNRRSVSEIQISVHSMLDHSTGTHVNYTYGRSRQPRHDSSNTCLHDDKSDQNHFSKRRKHKYDMRDSGMASASDQCTTRAPVPTEDDRNRLLHTHRRISHGLFDMNLIQGSRPTSSNSVTSTQRYGSVNELAYHRQALEYQVIPYHSRQCCHETPRGCTDNRADHAASRVNILAQQVSEECDAEIVMDIVRTLRDVGDELDTKMRNNTEPFHQTVLDALKTNTGQVLLTTVKQFNLAGVAIDASLALLKLLSQ